MICDFDKIKTVYNHLEDEESKKVFCSRLNYNLTGDKRFVYELGKSYSVSVRINEWLNEQSKENLRVIYGCGKRGKVLEELFQEVVWDYFVDKNHEGELYNGIQVIAPDKISEYLPNVSVLISIRYDYRAVKDFLMELGIKEENIFVLQEWIEKRYFEDFLPHDENEVFVDCGACNGENSKSFVNWTKEDYKKIFLFEPSVEYYNRYAKDLPDNSIWIKKEHGMKMVLLNYMRDQIVI